MTAETLLEQASLDACGRLRWKVMQRLGICPASLRGRLLTRRRALKLACQLVLDQQEKDGACTGAGTNPNFDMGRFERLARS